MQHIRSTVCPLCRTSYVPCELRSHRFSLRSRLPVNITSSETYNHPYSLLDVYMHLCTDARQNARTFSEVTQSKQPVEPFCPLAGVDVHVLHPVLHLVPGHVWYWQAGHSWHISFRRAVEEQHHRICIQYVRYFRLVTATLSKRVNK